MANQSPVSGRKRACSTQLWRWASILLGLQAIIFVIIGAVFLLNPPGGRSQRMSQAHFAGGGYSQSISQAHFVGGFSLDSPDLATNAARNGVQEAIMYGSPVTEQSRLGQVFSALQVHEADGYLWYLLYQYECHRQWSLKKNASNTYCPQDYPQMASETTLLGAVTDHLKSVAQNRLINAYWVLDDWPSWDEGAANGLLQAIHALIQTYTPDRPAICGFGGELGPQHRDTWNSRLFLNFSPQGCDLVALYIYSTPVVTSKPPPPSATFDWSMSGILPQMLAALRKRGWDSEKEPLIGIVQAWAGVKKDSPGLMEVTPTAADIATQSLSFCKAGAQSLVFYSWDDPFTTESPFTNAQISQGVQLGVQACGAYWKQH